MTLADTEVLSPFFAVNTLPVPEGRFLYSATGVSGSQILIHAIEPNGELTNLNGTATNGTPVDLAINGAGNILALTQSDETIHTYLRDSATGELTYTGFSVEVDGQTSNIRSPKFLGDFLYVVDQFSSDNGIIGIFVFYIGLDGDITQVGDAVSVPGDDLFSQEIWRGMLLGDLNGDNTLTLLDVAPFVDAITVGKYIPIADMNCDGVLDLLDISPFVDNLSGN